VAEGLRLSFDRPAVAPVKPGAVFKDPTLCFWGTLRFRLKEGLRCRTASGALQQGLLHWIAQQGAQAHLRWPVGGVADDASVEAFAASLANWADLSQRQRALVLQIAKQAEDKLLQQAHRDASQSFKTWLLASFSSRGRQAHAWARQGLPDEAFGSLPELKQVQEVAQEWQDLWTQAPVDQNRIALPIWMQGLRRRAEERRDQLLPIAEAQLEVALAKASSSAGMGCDQWQVARWRQLDAEGRMELLALLRQVEDELAWPAQTLLIQMAKLPKPAGGHRLIGLTSALYRLWS